MTETKRLLERARRQFPPTSDAMEALVRRRDRKRRNQRVAAGVVGIAVFVAAIGIVMSVGPLDRSDTSVVPRGDVTGPAETGVENPEPAPSVEPVQIGTVTRSGAGCALEIVADPIPTGAGSLTLVNETNRWVTFELFRFDPQVLTFAQFEAFVTEAREDWGPRGASFLLRRSLAPDFSGTITPNFTTGAFAVVCVDEHTGEYDLFEGPVYYPPIALVGPIKVETAPAETGPTETGPTDTGWVEGPNPAYDLPPEGAVPSGPVEGEVVDEYDDGFNSFVFVYADGRVISYSWPDKRINERRLTPEGVELVRSGEVGAGAFLGPGGLLTSAQSNVWEDPDLKRFVPTRYSVCYGRERNEPADPSTLLRFFPAPARAILLRAGTSHAARTPLACNGGDARSYMVTTDEARELSEILGAMSADYPTPATVTIEDSEGVELYWDIRMMLPDGPPPCIGCF